MMQSKNIGEKTKYNYKGSWRQSGNQCFVCEEETSTLKCEFSNLSEELQYCRSRYI